MASFDMYTRISIEIYVPFPGTTTDFNGIYDNLPPYIGKGLIVKPDETPETWTLNNFNPEVITIPSDIDIPSGSVIYTAHELLVSNSSVDEQSHPCLQTAPVISEALPSLTSGITDTQGINFILLDPSLNRFFSSDFVTVNSKVVMHRMCRRRDGASYKANGVFVGYITSVTHNKTNVNVSCRSDMKRLEESARFGFEDEVIKWNINDYKIPVISARLIPYTINVQRHSPQIVSSYKNWRRDYKSLFLHVIREDLGLIPESGGGS